MEQIKVNSTDTIAAIATPTGVGGIAVLRVSGPDALKIVNKAWKGCNLEIAPSHTVHLGKYLSLEDKLLDQAVATVYRAPGSFTGENVVEISVHGSVWIQRQILNDLTLRGSRIAEPGEFTKRAFLNGKLDLAQAEGIADLIAASSKAAHDLALSQVKGTFSKEFNNLREKLIEFASLMELELDFSEEDVEFVDREKLTELCNKILEKIDSLAESFSKGEVLKKGVPVVIAGIPNAGKSSLLNLLLKEEKAIVTDIPGTTRDIIEDTVEIDGILYRFIDTAGLRETTDKVEEIGVSRAKEALQKAYIVIWVIDPTQPVISQLTALKDFKEANRDKHVIVLINKVDLLDPASASDISKGNTADTLFTSNYGNEDESELVKTYDILRPEKLDDIIQFSVKEKEGITQLIERLSVITKEGTNPELDILVTNARHYEALVKASTSLRRAKEGIETGLPSDLVAQDIREAISHLSAITGTITTTHLLHSIFSRFCIGK